MNIFCGVIEAPILLSEQYKEEPASAGSSGRVYEKVLSALVLFYVLIITGNLSQNCHTKYTLYPDQFDAPIV